MASQDTKVDLINGAYSQLRISGIVIVPSPYQMKLALRRLESAMAALVDIWNIQLPFNFEEEPDFGSPHNLNRSVWDAIEVYLGFCLANDHGKKISTEYALRLKGAMSTLFKATASIARVQSPGRMPIGRRNQILPYNRAFFPITTDAPDKSSTVVIYSGDRNSFIESFLQELNDGEAISSFTIEVNNGLTVNSSSNTDSAVAYDITAQTVTEGAVTIPEMKIVVTTDANRIITHILNFKILVSEI